LINRKATVGILTLGCKVNQYESEAIAEEAARRGITAVPFGDDCADCDAYIINTCTVTAESDRKSRQMIRRAMSKNRKAYILVIGCYSQLEADEIAGIDGVDYVGGNVNKLGVVDELEKLLSKGEKPNVPNIVRCDLSSACFEKARVSEFGRTRAYMKIEDGCESKCAYCVIPRARGPIRSKPLEEAVAEAAELAGGGFREIVLTGIEISAYQYGLAELMHRLEDIELLQRVRISSIDPASITPAFTDVIADCKKTAPHFHLSLQNGSDNILRRMRRKYNTDMVKKYVAYMRSKIPDINFTADVIVGFPGETEEDFIQSQKFLEEIGLLSIHIFTYSKRKGTEAAEMTDQISEKLKKERAARLAAAAEKMRCRIIEGYIGREFPVLFETYEDGYAVGHTPNFLEVRLKANRDLRGEIRNVKLVEYNKHHIYGEEK